MDELGIDKLESWDIAYASEKLRAKRYAFSDQEVKQYFPETQVLPGMFELVQSLYQLKISEQKAETWHKDVRFFDIRDARRRTDRPVLRRPVCARHQARRRLDGRRDLAAPAARRESRSRLRT